MSQASKGKQKSETHKASMLKSNRRSRYLITFPDSTIQETDSLTHFAKQYNLSQSALSRCSSGEYKMHKGFSVKMIEDGYHRSKGLDVSVK